MSPTSPGSTADQEEAPVAEDPVAEDPRADAASEDPTTDGPGSDLPTADPPSAAAPAPEVKSWGWHVMQITSWLLVVLLPVHVLSTWVFHDPGHFGVALYVDRWHHGVWRLFDGTLVVAALVHGGIGLDSALGRHTTRPGLRGAITVAIAVVLISAGALALSTIMTFNVP